MSVTEWDGRGRQEPDGHTATAAWMVISLMKLKLGDRNHTALQDGKPVCVKDSSTDLVCDALGATQATTPICTDHSPLFGRSSAFGFR